VFEFIRQSLRDADCGIPGPSGPNFFHRTQILSPGNRQASLAGGRRVGLIMPGVYLKEVAQLVTKLKIESSPSNATEAPLWISNSDFIQCQTLAEISMEHPWGVYPIPHMALEATKMGGCQNCLKIWRRPCEVKVQLRDSAKSLLTATWRESGGIGKRPHQSRSQLSA